MYHLISAPEHFNIEIVTKMYPGKCTICGTDALKHSKATFMSYFPKDKERCRQWVKYVGNEDLVYIPLEKLIVLKQVCSKHFLPKDLNKDKNKLKESAVPSVNLTRKPLTDDILNEFPLHLANAHVPSDHAGYMTLSKFKYLYDYQGGLTNWLSGNSTTTDYIGNNVHEDLVKVWSNILCQGLPTRLKTNIMDKYNIPTNCELLSAPSFNQQIMSVLSVSTNNRDQVMKTNQHQLGLGISALGRVLTILHEDKSRDKTLEKVILNDACNILTDLHFKMSQHRLSMLTGDESFSIVEDEKSTKQRNI